MLSELRYVSDEGIGNIAKHKFHAGQYTPLDLALNPFWLWCQKLLPRWISPNAVSLFGGVCCVIGTVMVVSGDSSSSTPLLWNAVLLFLYQTADAVDRTYATNMCVHLSEEHVDKAF